MGTIIDSRHAMSSDLHTTLEHAARSHLRHRVLAVLLSSLPWVALVIVLCFASDILLHLSSTAREWIRNGLLVLSVLLLLAAAGIALLRRQPTLRTARLIEDRMPELDSRLINLLQLKEQALDSECPELTRALTQRAIDDAARDLPLEHFCPAIRPPRLAKRLAFAAMIPALLFLLTLISGEPGSRQWARFLDPHGDHPPLSFTQLEITAPQANGFLVAYRDSFQVLVHSSGHRPHEVFLSGVGESGTLLFSLPMHEIGEGSYSVQVQDIREPLYIFAHLANNAALSTRRHINVILEPRIERAWVTVQAPDYTGQEPKKLPFRFAGLRAMQGSSVEFTVESNRPLGPSHISYEIPGQASTDHPLLPPAEGTPGSVIGRLPATATGRLVFHIKDIDGRPAGETPSSSITVTHDAEPAVSLLFPTEDSFVVEGMILELIAAAADDIGIRSLRLHSGIDGEFTAPEVLRFDPPGETRHRLSKSLNLAALGLKSGQTITVFADAIDGAPEPQFSRTETRTLTLISEDEYNDYLRRQADVALIAGKYEQALEHLRQAIIEQKEIEAQLKTAAELPPEQASAEVGEALQRQQDLNLRLEDIAREFRDINRDNPVYDFEKDIAESLKEHAQQIEESIARNRRDLDQALSDTPSGNEVTPEELEKLQQAASEHRQRLEGEQEKADEQIQKPLEDLADFHEMLKNFNQLRHLAEQQQQLAEEAAAADRGQEPTPEDKAALRDLANRQRELGQKLDQLQKKLRQDAERLRDEMPEMAEAAEQLADQLENQGMPGQARDAAQEMLDGNAPGANQQAQQLKQQLAELMQGPGQAGEQAAGDALAEMLQGMGMAQGNNFQQLLQSLRFTPPGMGMSPGGSGLGMAGMQAQGMSGGRPQAMLGGESLMGGDIARRLAGLGGGGSGLGKGPGNTIESPELTAENLRSQRRTDTPDSATLLMEYEDIADAYFERLTAPNP